MRVGDGCRACAWRGWRLQKGEAIGFDVRPCSHCTLGWADVLWDAAFVVVLAGTLAWIVLGVFR